METESIENFNKDLQELLKKHRVALIPQPQFLPDEKGGYRISAVVQIKQLIDEPK